MIPQSFIAASALGLATVVAGMPRHHGPPCNREFPCTTPEVCVPTKPSCRNLGRCPGRCVIQTLPSVPDFEPIEPAWVWPNPPLSTILIDEILTTPPPENDPILLDEPLAERTTLESPVVDPVVDPTVDPAPVIQSFPEEVPQVDPIPTPDLEIDPVPSPIDTTLPLPEPEIEPNSFNPGILPSWPVGPLLDTEPIPLNPDIDPDWLVDPFPWQEPEIDPIPFNPNIDPVWPFDPITSPDADPVPRPRNEYPSCGGFRINPPACPEGSYCATDTRNPWADMVADLAGICISRDAKFCGGFAGLECPEGFSCYDYPGDGCNPRRGGADCIGICL